LIVQEDRRPVDSPYHDMVQGAGYIEPCLSWHGMNLSRSQKAVKKNAT